MDEKDSQPGRQAGRRAGMQNFVADGKSWSLLFLLHLFQIILSNIFFLIKEVINDDLHLKYKVQHKAFVSV